MWEDVKRFNLTEMGYNTSLISTGIMSNTFRAYKSRVPLVITSESLSLIRRISLTNRLDMKHSAMVKLKTLVRTHHGNKEEPYGRCIQKEDKQDRLGFQFRENSAKGRDQGRRG
ncbi:3-ketoacyl-CoA synthase 12 [Linum grandiflorum]